MTSLDVTPSDSPGCGVEPHATKGTNARANPAPKSQQTERLIGNRDDRDERFAVSMIVKGIGPFGFGSTETAIAPDDLWEGNAKREELARRELGRVIALDLFACLLVVLACERRKSPV